MINDWWRNCSSVNICENNVSRAWDLEKSWVQIGFEPMTFRTLGGRSIHWATRTHGEPGIYLPSCNFAITHLLLFTTYSLLNPAGERRRMSCKNSVKWPGSPWILVAQWIKCPPGVRKAMGSNLIGTQIFSRSHARVTLWSQQIMFELRKLHDCRPANQRISTHHHNIR